MSRLIPVLLLWCCAALLAFQKQPIPDYPGDDNPQHDGQPMWCANFDTKEHTRNCECQAKSKQDCEHRDDYGPDTGSCKVFCRKHACTCQTACET